MAIASGRGATRATFLVRKRSTTWVGDGRTTVWVGAAAGTQSAGTIVAPAEASRVRFTVSLPPHLPRPEDPPSVPAGFPFDGPFAITFHKGKILPGGARLEKDLVVHVAREDGLFTVTSEQVPLFGEGDTAAEAVADFLRRLAPHLGWLETEEGHLESGMLEELATLRRYVARA